LYADNWIAGATNVEDEYKFYVKTKLIMAEGNFNLRKWNSNSPHHINQIRKEEQLNATNQIVD